jgi:acyl-CoA synthetase (AMP-forming)/AMP-acid ligase II
MNMWKACPDKYPFAESLDQAIAEVSGLQPNPKIRKKYVQPTDTALLIYTSGTTGLPKAAKINHASIIFRSLNFKVVMGLNIFDRIYCALPLYHTSGGNLAVGMMIFSGAMLYISRRFSISRFWKEVRQNECTIIQYIGEMCRYLLHTPPQKEDKKNKVSKIRLLTLIISQRLICQVRKIGSCRIWKWTSP